MGELIFQQAVSGKTTIKRFKMELSILTLCYLIASVTFILGLKMLSNPATAGKEI